MVSTGWKGAPPVQVTPWNIYPHSQASQLSQRISLDEYTQCSGQKSCTSLQSSDRMCMCPSHFAIQKLELALLLYSGKGFLFLDQQAIVSLGLCSGPGGLFKYHVPDIPRNCVLWTDTKSNVFNGSIKQQPCLWCSSFLPPNICLGNLFKKRSLIALCFPETIQGDVLRGLTTHIRHKLQLEVSFHFLEIQQSVSLPMPCTLETEWNGVKTSCTYWQSIPSCDDVCNGVPIHPKLVAFSFRFGWWCLPQAFEY